MDLQAPLVAEREHARRDGAEIDNGEEERRERVATASSTAAHDKAMVSVTLPAS